MKPEQLSEPHTRILDLGLLAPLIQAVQTVFRRTMQMEAVASTVLPMPGGLTTYGLSTVIQLTGSFHACVVISLEECTGLAVASALCAQTLTEVDATVIDAICELGNLIVGSAKVRCPGKLSMSLPRVSTSQIAVARGPRLIIPCHIPPGEFTVEISQ